MKHLIIANICAILFAVILPGCKRVKDAPPTAASPEVCHPEDGLSPLSPCTPENPCTFRGNTRVTTPTMHVQCKTTVQRNTFFDDGAPKQWTDTTNTTRQACLFEPEGTSRAAPRPLIIWLHGGSGHVTNLYNSTYLRAKATQYDLSGDAQRPGFILLALQARQVHYPYGRLRDNTHFDTVHWNPKTNQDIAAIDHWIDHLAKTGKVDTRRIYLIGWSEGLMLSHLYGLHRHKHPTPAGHRVAAITGFSASSPFDRLVDADLNTRCQKKTLPKSNLPTLTISRACDSVACNKDQRHADGFADVIPMDQWQEQLKNMGAAPKLVLIDNKGNIQNTCAPRCSKFRGAINHISWPNGLSDRGGIDHEPLMLDFLKKHPLAQQP